MAQAAAQRWLAPAAPSRRNLLIAADDALAAGKPYAERVEPLQGTLDQIAEFLAGATIRPLRRLVRDPSASLRVIVQDPTTDAELYRSPAEIPVRLST